MNERFSEWVAVDVVILKNQDKFLIRYIHKSLLSQSLKFIQKNLTNGKGKTYSVIFENK